jgi:Nucleotidyl transferase AbiEii toxin, Type IV TA system
VGLRVPTLAAFAAMKTIAWADRHAARDLYDLAGLARLGALDGQAKELFKAHMGWSLAPHLFEGLPELDWEAQLSRQTRILPSAVECVEAVRAGYGL